MQPKDFHAYKWAKKIWEAATPTASRKPSLSSCKDMSMSELAGDITVGHKNQLEDDTPPPTYEFASKAQAEDEKTMPGKTYELLEIVAAENEEIETKVYWFLLEILAMTFSVDCGKTEEARIDLHGEDSGLANSSSHFLSAEYSATLKELCTLVRDLEENLRLGREMRRQDKQLLMKILHKPCQKNRLDLAYVLEMLGRYETFPVGTGEDKRTLIDYWAPRSLPSGSLQRKVVGKISPSHKYSMMDLADTLKSHDAVFARLQKKWPNQLFYAPLKYGIDNFKKERGFENLPISKQMETELAAPWKSCFWPLTDEYIDLTAALMADEYMDFHGDTHKRLRKARNLRR
ncbi:unnamed protein product [Periconia digitata]|uniref:Uncharacterized protein n=1 Tax=Periconia digitata TaxID=1303443 RepID=A0A9W4XWF6_9PLEO|nr:unnamed protein product [Periconia digitata]